MQIPFTPIVDFAGSLALVGMLVLSYGAVRRHMPGLKLAPTLLGVLFGVVAVLQMHAPIAPQPGLLIDLRNVPVILAGAFLGLRGFAACIVVAAAGRIGIGGVGWASGVTAMILCGGGGLAWDALTRGRGRRGMRAMVGLWAMVLPHVASLLLLPREVAIWYLTVPMPLLVAVYLLSIMVFGRMLETERMRMDREARMRAAVLTETGPGFASRAGLDASLTQAIAAGRYDDGISILRVRMRPGFAQSGLWGENLADHVLVALHARIAPLLPQGAEVGLVRDDTLAIMLPADRAEELGTLARRLREEVGSQPIHLPGTASARPVLQIDRRDYDHVPPYATLLDGRPVSRRVSAAPTVEDDEDHHGDPRLFEMAERLLALHDREGAERRRA